MQAPLLDPSRGGRDLHVSSCLWGSHPHRRLVPAVSAARSWESMKNLWAECCFHLCHGLFPVAQRLGRRLSDSRLLDAACMGSKGGEPRKRCKRKSAGGGGGRGAGRRGPAGGRRRRGSG